MNLSNYPYFIYGLDKKITKEKSFLAKYFLMSDLFYSSLKYFNFLFNQKTDNNQFKTLKKAISKNDTPLFQELNDILNENIASIELIDKSLKSINSKKLQNEEFYQSNINKILPQLEELLLKINKAIDFELLLPFSLSNNNLNSLNLNRIKSDLVQTENLYKYSPKNITKNSKVIVKFKKSDEFLMYKIPFTNKNYSQQINPEDLLNSFSKYITGTELFKVKISVNKKHSSPIPDKNIETDIYIKREVVSEKINKFVTEKDSGYLFIVGAFGTGKSTLINNFEAENKYKTYKTIIDRNSYKKNLKDVINNISPDTNINNSQEMLRLFHAIKSNNKQIIIFEDIHLLDKIDEFLKFFPQKLPENIYILFTMAARESIILPMLENRELYYIPSFNYNETKALSSKILNYKNIFYNYSVEDILKKTYGFPLFIKIYLNNTSSYYLHKQFEIEKKFFNLVNQFEEYTIRYDRKLKNFAKYFFILLSISKEGFTKNEIISILPPISNILIESYIDRSSEYLVKVNGRYKLSSFIFEEICINNIASIEDLNFLHNKIIEFYEPWDKKVSSLSLKYLPYHYLQLGKLDKVKSLMLSSFTKSKFKLYPKETLDDLQLLTKHLINTKGSLHEIFHFSFIHQRLRDNEKREFLNIFDLTESGKFEEIISKAYSINKSFERFLQLLIIGTIAADNKKLLDSKNAIKKMINLPNIQIGLNNSEIVFKLCAEVLSQGIFDVINLPRNRDDGINIIKNLKETEFSYKVIEIILKLIEGLSNEIDKSVILESLLNKIIDFESMITIEKFYKDILLIIDKIKNDNIRDRIYHVYILCILKKPDIYNIFLNNLLQIKDKIKTTLFKYLFYNSLSVLFIKLKQEKISRDFIISSISFIEELDNLNHIPFMMSNLIFTIKHFENTYFYDEIISKTFVLINDISFSYEGLQNKLNLINNILNPNQYKDQIKSTINQALKIDLSAKTDSEVFQFLKSSIDAIFKIKDKRTFNSLLKKVLKNFNDKKDEIKISLFLCILDYVHDELIFNELIALINNGNNTENKIKHVIENINTKNTYSSEISDIIMNLILHLDKDSEISTILISIIYNMDKKNINPGEKFAQNIYEICTNIDSVKNKLKVLTHLSYFLVNVNQKESGLQLIRRIFAILLNENDETKYQIIKENFENIHNIRDSYRLYYCLSDILVNTYNLSHYIKDDGINVKIAEEIFKNITKLQFSDLKNVFYRTLEIANKTVNAKNKMQLVNLTRKYLPFVSEKNFIIDILQKSILISEENFSDSDLKLMSLVSLAYVNRINGDIDKGKSLFKRFISELRFSSYEEYISETVIHTAKIIHKINDKEESISLFKSLIESDIYLNNEIYILNTYTAIVNNLVKIADIYAIHELYVILIKVSVKLENPRYKSEYLIRLVSAITNFKITKQTLDLIHKIFTLSYFIKDERELSNFYKSFIISINKSLSMYPLDDTFSPIFNERIQSYLKSIEKSIDNTINNISLKSEILSLLGLAHYKFDKSNNKNQFFEKSIQLIKLIQENEYKTGIETLTALRMIATKDLKQGNKILENIVDSIVNQKDDKTKFNLFEIFISYKNHISKSDNYREYIENMIKGSLQFNSDIFRNKMYIFAFNYYYENKDIDNTYYFIDKAQKALARDESYDSTDQKINLGISLLRINQYNKGSDILISLIDNINNKPKRILYELIIKIFYQLSTLNQSKYKPVLFEKIISELQKINLKEISENDLYTLVSSYANIKDISEFNSTIGYIDNIIQKEKLIDLFIEILSIDEDIDNLLNLLPFTLFSPKLTDKIIASIIVLLEEPNKIKEITDNLSI